MVPSKSHSILSPILPDFNGSVGDEEHSPRTELLSPTSNDGVVERRRRNRRAPGERYRRERELAHSGTQTRDLMRLLINEEYESKRMRKALYTVFSRLEAESQRATDAERHALETSQQFRSLNEARLTALQQASRANEELGLYKFQLHNAQGEILRAQEILRVVEGQRDEADAAAARARTTARELNQERLVNAAREEGRQLGFEAGLRRGQQLGFDSAVEYNDGPTDLKEIANQPFDRAPGNEGDYPGNGEGETFGRNYSPAPLPTQLLGAPGTPDVIHDTGPLEHDYNRQDTAAPPENTVPLRYGLDNGNDSTAHSFNVEYVDDVGQPGGPTTNSVPMSNPANASNPVFDQIPVLRSEGSRDGRTPSPAIQVYSLAIPPPHALERPPPSPHSPSMPLPSIPLSDTGSISGSWRPEPPAPVRVHDYAYTSSTPPPPPPPKPRRSSLDSGSTTLSQLDLVSPPHTVKKAKSRGLSIIPEDVSRQPSPAVEPSVRSRSQQRMEYPVTHVSERGGDETPKPGGYGSVKERGDSISVGSVASADLRNRQANQRIADELRYSDPNEVEEWRRAGTEEVRRSNYNLRVDTDDRPRLKGRSPLGTVRPAGVPPISQLLRPSRPTIRDAKYTPTLGRMYVGHLPCLQSQTGLVAGLSDENIAESSHLRTGLSRRSALNLPYVYSCLSVAMVLMLLFLHFLLVEISL